MHILLVTHFFPSHGGGVEKVAAQFAERMARCGHTLTWCASSGDPLPQVPGIECVAMPAWHGIERRSGFPFPLWSVPAVVRLAREVRAAEAVHVHDAIYFGSLMAGVFARMFRKRLVVSQHIGEKPLPMPVRLALALAYRVGARLVLAPAAATAFISPAGHRYFLRITRGRYAKRFFDVPNGVDTALFSPGPSDAARARAGLGFDPARPLMLFVGRFVPTKRLPLLRAMAAQRPDWQWVVIGHGPERPESWGLANVAVRGPYAQAELAAWYRAADLLVLPSHGEGFPLVVQEAMACGLPALITAEVAAGGALPAHLWLELPEAPGDASGIATGGVRAIEAWLALSRAQRDEQRLACARHAREQWNWDTAVQRLLAWLRGVSI